MRPGSFYLLVSVRPKLSVPQFTPACDDDDDLAVMTVVLAVVAVVGRKADRKDLIEFLLI